VDHHAGTASCLWRHVYGVRDERQARAGLHNFYTAATNSDCPEIERLARTIEA
jgi:hypothetical protein